MIRRLKLVLVVTTSLLVSEGFGHAIAQAPPPAPTVSAATPRLSNAQIVRTSGSGDLGAIVRGLARRRQSPGWIGWAVPMVPTAEQSRCGGDGRSWNDAGCCGSQLEDEGRAARPVNSDRPVSLESGGSLFVFLRVDAGAIQKIRTLSDDCEIDGNGMPIDWLVDVQPSASIAFLMGLVTRDSGIPDSGDGDADLGRQAVGAISLHAGVEAEQALVRLLDPGQPVSMRKHATFWLGSVRGRFGLDELDRVLDGDPSLEVRDAATFGLFVSREAGAVPRLIEAAKNDASGRVRGQALFWLAQKAGAQAQRAITDAIDRDPETEVKKKAVFALTQLPEDEGVPLLIRVAQTSPNPAVRKQAMFWLGQSHDDRAVAFFERILR